MTATLRYQDGTGAVYNSPEEALAQARHDLGQPINRDPLAIIDGDASRHLERVSMDDWKPKEHGRVLERNFEPCECHACEFQREAPTLHHEDRAVYEEMLWARLILDRDLTPAEIKRLEKVIGSTRQFAERLRAARAGKGPFPIAGGTVPGAGFSIRWTAIALTAATAKTLASAVCTVNTPVDLPELGVSGDGATGNVLIEIVYGTGATAGTSTPFTPGQFRGRGQTITATCATNYTAEPTVLTVMKSWRLPWPTGPLILQSPLGRELNSVTTASASGKLIGLRLTSTTAVTNSDGYMEIEE